ncbi:hypothetical protein MSAN_02378000 [Mycena sanguinolenta]|uniref:Uncharacterized protein n=1 Tax=Mycena sanguinolenta TaxID=230812 RepID=A0A8H7CFS6_9AGAR|nr:hypothetical protein MSAN_02378000 [Mycena sanguinolenta]
MDLHADSEPDFIALSTSDNAESMPHPDVVSPHASRRARKAKPFIKLFSFLPSLLKGRFQTSRTSKAHTQKHSKTKPERQAAEHLVNNHYNYHITGGFGGSGGEGFDQGGDGGAGHGPIVHFGQPQARESSGDLKLVKEVHFSPQSGVVGRQSRGVRIYHAEIRCDPGTVTVAMYRGDGAEEEWRQHVAKYESIRHPYIMQLYGLVSTKGLYAMEARNYISDIFQKPSLNYNKRAVWIRHSTGGLCLDLGEGMLGTGFTPPLESDADVLRVENISLDAFDSEDMIISSLTRFQRCQISTQHLVGPGIFLSDSQYGTWVRITEPLILPEEKLHWDNYGRAPEELLPNSWIRYDSRRIRTLKLELRLSFWSYAAQKAWLAQANHIFVELQEREHIENYVCVYQVLFTLRVGNDHHIDPKGYLFVCPAQDFRIGPENANLYQWPACPAYWSLDPFGAARLSTQDAESLGFPAIHIETIIAGESWYRSVYEGLRRFHEGKGFDPDSREVARQLGYPLYEVLSNRVPFPAREVEIQNPWCGLQDPVLCRELGHFL